MTRPKSNTTKKFKRFECIILTPQTNEVMVKSDFDVAKKLNYVQFGPSMANI